MSPVNFLKYTIVGQGAISYTLSYTCAEVFQDSCRCTRKVKVSVQEIAPCPKRQEIWIFFQYSCGQGI